MVRVSRGNKRTETDKFGWPLVHCSKPVTKGIWTRILTTLFRTFQTILTFTAQGRSIIGTSAKAAFGKNAFVRTVCTVCSVQIDSDVDTQKLHADARAVFVCEQNTCIRAYKITFLCTCKTSRIWLFPFRRRRVPSEEMIGHCRS